MKIRRLVFFGILALCVSMTVVCGCRSKSPKPARMTEEGISEARWTGVAVSRSGRMFVNYPRWSADIPMSVGERTTEGACRPFPDSSWNAWDPSGSVEDRFVCVQSVFVDRNDMLWILDSGNSIFHGKVIPGGARLVKVDLASNRVVQVVSIDSLAAPSASYLNDVRVDEKRGWAYITDSGLGALVAVDLGIGASRRLLADHPSTKSEGVVLTIDGTPWLTRDGKGPDVHSDGIALDSRAEYVYYQALTGRTLYRIAAKWLRNTSFSDAEIAGHVESLGEVGASDGILFGPDGCLYLTSLEHNAIRRRIPDGSLEIVVKDLRLKWPDTLAFDSEGNLYVACSQIHLGSKRTEPFRIFKIYLP